MKRADFDHHLEGLAQKEVTDKNAGFIAPQHAGREFAASHLAIINHVIMEQGRGVHEFNRCG